MLVYLGGPIDAVTSEVATGWRDLAAVQIGGIGLATFDPSRPYGRATTKEAKQSIVKTNRKIIEVCDVGLFKLNGKAFGTIREIELFRSLRKPVVIYGDPGLKDHLEAVDLGLARDLDHAVEMILQLVKPTDFTPIEQMDLPIEGDPATISHRVAIGDQIREYHEKKEAESGHGPYISPEPMTDEIKAEEFLKAWLSFTLQATGMERMEIDSHYFYRARNDKKTKVQISVVEHITSAELVRVDGNA